MEVERLNFILEKTPEFRTLLQGIDEKRFEIIGCDDELRLIITAELALAKEKSVLYITENEDRAKKLFKTIRKIFPSDSVGYYPPRELLPYDSFTENRDLSRERIRIIEGLLEKKSFFAVASATTLSQKLLPKNIWQELSFSLKVGDIIDIDKLVNTLVELGYRRDSLTDEAGSFSLRGSIVDFFPIAAKNPYRLDFFDDEIEAIRIFNPETQISLGETPEVNISPATQFIIMEDKKTLGLEKFMAEADARVSKMKTQRKKNAMDKAKRLYNDVMEGSNADYLIQLLPYFYEETSTLLEYLAKDDILVLDEAVEIRKTLDAEDEERQDFYTDMLLEGEVFPSYIENFSATSVIWKKINSRPHLGFSFIQTPTGLDTQELFTMAIREFSFYREREERGYELRELSKKGQIILCGGEDGVLKQMEGFAKTWEITNYRLCHFPLEKSLELTELPGYLLSEKDFFGIVKQPQTHKNKDKANAINSFVDLKEGDYVVHENHGIGQYIGMERLTVNDVSRDYLHIRYRGEDKLFIPTDQMDLLQKYIGNSDSPPKINKLGGKDWQTVKAKARGSVQEMAADLLTLYAQREAEKGFAFAADTPWQWEMESDFPYEETSDQNDAIIDMKEDMEKEKPMDRLLCGDVGYGKTEVAIRGAFKAVMDGKQCAVLVPTTVLAQQHEITFAQRLEKFGVTVRALSRFKSAKEIKETLQGLENGSVDIVIGTHMLFGKRVKYKDLGLLIIDEEQRFGVAHKEKIKELKKNIDVLAMSATPIPRTLHMSLLGARDISIIQTPPARRQPVRTYVMEYQPRIVKEAILRELMRNGQVYYIHNRVEDIHTVAEYIHELVPDAKIVVGHGQMAEKELEKVMLDFMNGEADILLCTTIVESGLDFPNVNTLIVDEADRLGLSQMYQLRGRVGRSRKQGYAYFFYGKGGVLAMPARKRLGAIRDYTDLGSGFKIALRDMEIRGVGNILGPEQHGHMASVGFDLYCRLVNEEIKRLQGEEIPEEKEEVTIDIACSAYLPDDYVGDGDVKIELYKKIAELKTHTELKSLLSEVEDRFGSVPDSVYHLFLVARLKILAEKLGIVTISQQKDNFKVTFKGLNNIDGKDISALIEKFGKRFEFKMGEALEIIVKCGKLSNIKALLFLIKILVFTLEQKETEVDV
ncbi:MAG: transcription-repair coupling factor [Clostridiales bacterium]